MWKLLKVWTSPRLAAMELEERVAALETSTGQLRHELAQSALEWDQLYDKMRVILGRVSKREARAREAHPDSEAPAVAPSPILNGDPILERYRAVLHRR